MVLKFEKEISTAEDVLIEIGAAARVLVSAGQEHLVDVAAQAGRQRDESPGVLGQKVAVDPGFVEALEEARRNELDEVAVAFPVLQRRSDGCSGLCRTTVCPCWET
jgi:hypothetical protein